jgi:hypothetical protein
MTGPRQMDAHVETARKALAEAIDKATHNPAVRTELSHLIAKFTAQVVRADRVHRHPHDSLAKLVDVFFNRRPA